MRRLVLVLFVLGPHDAWASGCTLTGNAPTVTATAIDFSGYSASAAGPDQANGTVQIKCPLGIGLLPSFDIALSAGNGGSGFSPRRMSMGANRLDYNIYTTSGYATVWGDGNSGTVTQKLQRDPVVRHDQLHHLWPGAHGPIRRQRQLQRPDHGDGDVLSKMLSQSPIVCL